MTARDLTWPHRPDEADMEAIAATMDYLEAYGSEPARKLVEILARVGVCRPSEPGRVCTYYGDSWTRAPRDKMIAGLGAALLEAGVTAWDLHANDRHQLALSIDTFADGQRVADALLRVLPATIGTVGNEACHAIPPINYRPGTQADIEAEGQRARPVMHGVIYRFSRIQ